MSKRRNYSVLTKYISTSGPQKVFPTFRMIMSIISTDNKTQTKICACTLDRSLLQTSRDELPLIHFRISHRYRKYRRCLSRALLIAMSNRIQFRNTALGDEVHSINTTQAHSHDNEPLKVNITRANDQFCTNSINGSKNNYLIYAQLRKWKFLL